MARTRTVSYDDLTLGLLLKGEKPGSKKLGKLAEHAAQAVKGGFCPECGSGGDHEFNGTYYQCADQTCLALWEPGDNAETVEDVLEAIA